MSQAPMTKPEFEILNAYLAKNPMPPLDLLFDYQREDYHFVAYPLALPNKTVSQRTATARLVARGLLIGDGGSLYLHPDHYETLYGNTFTLTCSLLIHHEWKREIARRDEQRANIDAAQDGTLSSYRVDSLWELYTNAQAKPHHDPLVAARHAAWIACGKQGLAFFHYLCDAFTNSERSLQALERVESWVALKGYHWIVARDTRLTF